MSKDRAGKHRSGSSSERRGWFNWLNPFSRRRGGHRGFFADLLWRFWRIVAHWLRWPVYALQVAFRWAIASLVEFWNSRDFRRLLWGTPFLLLVIGWGYLLIAGTFHDEAKIDSEYSKAASDAVAANDLAAARLYSERLALSRPNDHSLAFRLSALCSALGDHQRAQLLMDRLAPPDRPVYAPAHLAKAERILGGGTLDGLRFSEAQTQLLHAVSADPSDPKVRIMLGNLYSQVGWWSEAELHLAEAVKRLPQAALTYSKVLAMGGKKSLAQHYGKRAQSYFADQVAKNRYDVKARASWAEATMFLEEFDQAVKILEEGLLLSDSPEFRSGLARVYITWSDTLKGDTPDVVSQRFELLAKGLETNPHELMLFDRIMGVLEAGDAASQRAQELLTKNVAEGRALLLSHLLLGTYAGIASKTDVALFHLERAYEISPRMYIVANNLAWYLAHSEPPRLEEALTLINTVVAMYPTNPAVRDTRGQVLAKMGRWKEAIVDLEAALPSMRDDERLHQTLAVAYEALGMAELAEQHRKPSKQD